MGCRAKGLVNEEGRTCSKCGEFKLWAEFHTSNKGIRGKVSECKLCRKEYYEDNRDVLLEYQKQYYEENSDVIAEYQKQYREENKEGISEYAKQYYEDNKEGIAKYNKQWYSSPARYETFKDQLTTFESPRESKDGCLEVKCATCRKYYTPTNQQVQCRIRALSNTTSGENRLYCSNSCKESCSVFAQKKYPKGFKKPSNREFTKEFRNMILERDNYTCQVCNNKFDKKHLQAHHLTPVVCSPMEQVDIENGICVCKECHIDLHLTQEGITYAELIKAGKGKEGKDHNDD